jgi:hypothetical protein
MARHVGLPGPFERVCDRCEGAGQGKVYTGQFPTGYRPCDTCAATGVVRQTVPTISLWQPWASLIFTGDKVHETRAYPPPTKHVGQRIGIHAAKHLEARLTLGMELLCEREFGRAHINGDLPRGVLLGSVKLVAFGRTEDVEPFTVANKMAGDWSPGRWAWKLAHPQLLPEPVPYKGKQGWFMVDAECFAPDHA